MENKVKDNGEEERIIKEALDYAEHEPKKYHAYIAGATKQLERNKEDAIGFAEWAFGDDINPFVFSKGRWIQACGNSTSWSTEQLYEMYLNQKV